MYFKSLELIGFKSFAEKTLLNFEPGVTAIVGPNGCGKSNCVEAIRWVLGEQSAKSLRASSMEDVIFNGTDNKEPINLAEVSLTFSNEKRVLPIDYDEVTITRRVFRSGDSEYLLNKTPVRLKDISELLMGTGIGTESYSIIEQGKMDLILSSKPEDRRYVFEEASGITKYKSKKKEALRKLEQTEQNLLRINDIILEVKRQIGSIERQAKKAEKYKAEFEKLKDLELKSSLFEFRNLSVQEKKYSVEGQDLKGRQKEFETEIKSVSDKIADYRQSLEEVNEKISGLKHRSGELSNSLAMNTQKMTTDAERIEEARLSGETLSKEIESIKEKASAAAALVEKLKADLKKAAEELACKEKAVAEKDALLSNLAEDIEEMESKVKAAKTSTVDLLARETRIKNELIKLGADVQNRRARSRRLAIEKDTVTKELEASRGALDAILKEFTSVESKISAMRSGLEAKTALCETLNAGIKTLEARMVEEETARAAAKSRIEFLEEVVKKHEGFHQGVKSILTKMEEGERSLSGILGVLADMIKVERGYDEAVGMFLNSGAETLIAEKDSDITAAIEYLKANRLGKASFVSLETLKKSIVHSPRSIDKALTPLKKFVKAEGKFQAVVDYFFSDAFVADSLEEGLSKGGHSVTFVTKSGLLYDRGRISGGSTSDSDDSLIIGRRDKLSSLKVELKKIEERISSLSASRGEKNEAATSLAAEIKSLEEALHAEDVNFADIKAKKDAQEFGVRKLKEELSVVELELDESASAINDLTKKGEELNSELNSIEKENSDLQLFISESQAALAGKRAAKEKLALEVTALRAEMQSSDKEEASIRSNAEQEEAYLGELDETLASKEALRGEHAAKTKALEEEIASLKLQNEAISSELKALAAESSIVERSRSDMADKLGIGELQLKDREQALEALRNQARDIDVKLTELNYKKAALKDRILQAYKTDLDMAHVEIEEAADWDAVRAQVAELKVKLDAMGPVNLAAMDEHKELEERHAFLTHQHEDLLNAKETLLKAIQKINKTTKDLFLETFQKIQLEFKNFFRLLFGGGGAELVLIDEQDILESGIEIIVRPPGKKLQNLMLLSGGEKALTAIALLFSIFKVKPSPFCVLDEIDAPLDESNIGRFSNVLKDFLKMSQFIIITHNKRTIELADVMYGITMQERGISKIVSVKFADSREKESVKEKEADAVPA